jgi:glycosyltransferase involved in cell wall biosynthesis
MMPYTPGLVSVLVPCYNSERYIAEAIESIRNQTYPNLEIVVTNDGSTDGSMRLVTELQARDPRIRVASHHNRGLPAARNTGLSLARGEYVCFLDADDVMLEDKLARQVEFLRLNPGCDLVYSDWYLADERLNITGLVAGRITEPELMRAYARRNWFAVMAPLLRRELADRVGKFDESLDASEDWDYWIRCAQAGRFGYLPGAVAIYRSHPLQMHYDGARMFGAGKRTILKHFRSDRRLFALAMCCFYWASAKGMFHLRSYIRSAVYVVASEYYSLMAGGVALRVRDIDSIVLPPPAGAAFRNAQHA